VDFIWENPGFSSLTVPYGMANDFHFTVHVGLLIVFVNEFWAMGLNKTAFFTTALAVFQAVIVLILRGAYIIDLIAAVVFGYFFWILAMRLSYWIDVVLLGLPF